MNKESIQTRILLKQNTEMATKLQWYRRQNQELKAKNEEMNVWVQNLSEVFAAIASAWQNVTSMEEYLYNLMKKKSDVKDKTVINKYIAHFRTFPNIIENLSQKIQNTNHSNRATIDAKEQLTNFVKNYQMFFKEFVETYFKFNQQSLKYLEIIEKQNDLQGTAKAILSKQIQNRQKMKDFQTYASKFNQGFKSHEVFNQNKLLDGILLKKEEQIAQLKLQNMRQTRKLRVMMDYSPQSIQKLLQNSQNENYFECTCGGSQIKYYKTLWQQTSKNLLTKGKSISEKQIKEQIQIQNDGNSINHEKVQILQNQKNRLLERNSILLDKIDKMKIQNKLTEETILKSNVYLLLKQQCQHLINYSNDLMGRLRKQGQYLQQLQKTKDQEMRELKKKYDKQYGQITSQTSLGNLNQQPQKQGQGFKQEIVKLINQLKDAFRQINQRENKTQSSMNKTKTLILQLKKNNQDLNRKLIDYNNAEINKADKFQFKYEKYKEVEEKCGNFINSGDFTEQFKILWKDFINYFKSRDKKIKQYESLSRKKQKQLQAKEKIQQMIKEELTQTQAIFENNKKKLDIFEDFINKIQKQIVQLGQENFHLKNHYQQQKIIFEFKLKNEIQTKVKMEEKIKSYQKIEEQVQQFKRYQEEFQKRYNELIFDKNSKIQKLQLQSNEKSITIHNLQEQSNQKQKIINKLNSEKEGLKSEISEAQKRFSTISEKSQHEDITRELMYYKSKVMCVCTGDREREIALKTCPHFFCKRCIVQTLDNRNRKCPICGVKFSKADTHQIKYA